jgi:hypothetical protein
LRPPPRRLEADSSTFRRRPLDLSQRDDHVAPGRAGARAEGIAGDEREPVVESLAQRAGVARIHDAQLVNSIAASVKGSGPESADSPLEDHEVSMLHVLEGSEPARAVTRQDDVARASRGR